MVRTACAIWDCESLRMPNFPDAREVYERFGEDKSAVAQALAEGLEEPDFGMFMEDIPDVGEKKWRGNEILGLIHLYRK
jgi:hypothetical protein